MRDTMDNRNDEPYEEVTFRFFTWELKCKKPGKNTIKILVIISLLIISVIALIKYA
jgi:hypothetical protein